MPDRLMHEGQLLGNYRLVRLLGKGGFAEVYLAQHVHLNRLAAIKLLYVRVDGPDVKRFKREAQIVADLRHPHSVKIIDFAPRGTLRHQYPRGSLLPPTVVLEYIEQVAAALDFAHAKRVIHRDVKPENMLLGEQDELLLSDFGIATLISESGAQVTPHVAGTTAYMAPEQLRGKPCPASDQYALGVVVYEWLCGERPFRGSFAEIAAQHLNATPPSLHERNPHISPALEEVVSIALAKKPTQRYPTVGAFVADFKHALQTTGRSQFSQVSVPARSTRQRPRSSLSQLPTRERSGIAQPQPGDAAKHPISRRAILLSLGSVAMLGGIGGGLAWLTTHQHTAGPVRTTGTKAGSGAASPTSTPTPTAIPILTTLQIYSGHKDIVHAVAWSPDGNNIVSGSRDGTAQLWSVSTAQNILTYKKHMDIVDAVTWSFDAKYVASGSFDQTVQVWDAIKGNTVSTFSGLNRIVSSVSWSSVANRLASTSLNDDKVQLSDPNTGISNLLPYHIHSNFVYAVAWSPDGTRIATASGGGAGATVQVWDVTNNNIFASFNGHTGAVFTVTWSSDGKFIASGGSDKTVRIWNVATQQEVLTYQDHGDAVNTVAWCSKNPNIIASGSQDKTVRVWQAM